MTIDEMRKLADLANLGLEEGELSAMSAELSEILRHFQHIRDVDTREVAPLLHAVEVENVLREDVPGPSLTREESLANAPATANGFFTVPRVLDK